MKLSFKPIVLLYCSYIICLTVIFTFVIPPFQKPDEVAHFNRAFALSTGQVFCSKYPNGYGFIIPQSVLQFPKAMFIHAIIMQPQGKFPVHVLKNRYPIHPSPNAIFGEYCSLPFFSYIPSAFMIKVVEPFNNLVITFFAARFGMAILFIFMLTASFFIIPPSFRLLLVAYSIIPMVIHQVTAVSYDSPSIALSFLTFALFIRYAERKSVRFIHCVSFLGVLSFFLLMKPGYYFLFGLLLPVFLKIKGSLIQKSLLAFISAGVIFIVFQIATHL